MGESENRKHNAAYTQHTQTLNSSIIFSYKFVHIGLPSHSHEEETEDEGKKRTCLGTSHTYMCVWYFNKNPHPASCVRWESKLVHCRINGSHVTLHRFCIDDKKVITAAARGAAVDAAFLERKTQTTERKLCWTTGKCLAKEITFSHHVLTSAYNL